MDALEQLAPEFAFGMLPQASVRCPTDAVSALGVHFFRDEDDLDSYQAAVLRLVPIPARGRISGMAEQSSVFGTSDQALGAADHAVVFMVQRYDHEPQDSLTIFLTEPAARPQHALQRILSALHLTSDRLSYTGTGAPGA